MVHAFFVFGILPGEISIVPPWLKRETQICVSPIPAPTGSTASSQTRKEIKVWL
jgi:hypothetical protein